MCEGKGGYLMPSLFTTGNTKYQIHCNKILYTESYWFTDLSYWARYFTTGSDKNYGSILGVYQAQSNASWIET